MAYEDFTGYTELDPATYISKTSTQITYTSLPRGVDAWVYKDKGAAHFDGDFEHWVDIQADTADGSGPVGLWTLSNYVDDWKYLRDNNKDHLNLNWYRAYNIGKETTATLRLWESDGVNEYLDTSIDLNPDTWYYLKIKRDENVGTYGTLYCYIYPTSQDRIDGTNVVDTLTLTLHSSKKDFRYIFPLLSYNSGSGYEQSGLVANLDLKEAAPPTNTTNFFKAF